MENCDPRWDCGGPARSDRQGCRVGDPGGEQGHREPTLIFFLDFRARNTGGPVLPGRIIAPPGSDPNATELTLSLHSRVVYLVHGFNVDRTSGQQKLATLGAQVQARAPDAAIVAVTWPGDSWAGPLSYSFEGNDADDSGYQLARFIDRVHPAGTELSFVSHSLGARVVFEAVKFLAPGRYPVPQICVMAAAIDDFSVSAAADYRAEVEAAGRVAVLASARDPVLRLAYPLGDLLQEFVFFWKDVSGLALGFHGPRPARSSAVPANVVHVQIANALDVRHGDYLYSGAPNAAQARAAAFATAALGGDATLTY